MGAVRMFLRVSTSIRAIQVFRAIQDQNVLATILEDFTPPPPLGPSAAAPDPSPLTPQRKPRRPLSPSSSIVGGGSGSNPVGGSAVESLSSNGSSSASGDDESSHNSSSGPPRFSFSSSSERGSIPQGEPVRGGGGIIGRGRRPLFACLSSHHLTTTGYLPLLASSCLEALVTESGVERYKKRKHMRKSTVWTTMEGIS